MLFSRLYHRIMTWSVHPRAPYLLAFVAFIESIIFPVPVAFMLAPMVLAQPKRAWRYGFITTIASVLGGIVGYYIGYYFFAWVSPWVHQLGYWDAYQTAHQWIKQWGLLAVYLAGFSFIPYKIATLSAGALAMPLLPFLLGSLLGRATQFFLVAGILYWGGAKMEPLIRKYVEYLGWIAIILAIVAYLALR
jgi:membrane protein YqaA with SNARE-associated domain